jgi:hypothetical protein
MNNSRNIYNQLRTSSYTTREFMARVSLILDTDPYFIPGYLEHFWIAQRDNDARFKNTLLVHCKKIVDSIFNDVSIQADIIERWSVLEQEALRDLVLIFLKSNPSWFEKMKFQAQLLSIDVKFPVKNVTWNGSSGYLKKELSIGNLATLQKEVKNLEPYWWGVDRERNKISYHQDTSTIALRFLPSYNTLYTPVDGVHESIPSIFIDRMPHIHEAVLSFVKDRDLALGRVALVRMKPQGHSYRHYDNEEYLIDRNRFHLVLQAGDKNILSSGSDEVYASQGELWYFNNHVMHRTHNQSDTERIHLIFDGYPLAKLDK